LTEVRWCSPLNEHLNPGVGEVGHCTLVLSSKPSSLWITETRPAIVFSSRSTFEASLHSDSIDELLSMQNRPLYAVCYNQGSRTIQDFSHGSKGRKTSLSDLECCSQVVARTCRARVQIKRESFRYLLFRVFILHWWIRAIFFSTFPRCSK
jgi:hypothetical protein